MHSSSKRGRRLSRPSTTCIEKAYEHATIFYTYLFTLVCQSIPKEKKTTIHIKNKKRERERKRFEVKSISFFCVPFLLPTSFKKYMPLLMRIEKRGRTSIPNRSNSLLLQIFLEGDGVTKPIINHDGVRKKNCCVCVIQHDTYT